MTRGFLGALVLCATTTLRAAEVDPYDFPVADAITATVFGTPGSQIDELARPGEVRERTYRLDLHKPGLERFRAQRRRGAHLLEFSLAFQRGPAPLVVSIAGTGGSHDSGKSQLVKRMLFRAGFHVLSLSSPSSASWIFTASSTDHAGMTPHDAEDLYRVLQAALGMVRKRIEITDIDLTGYSLGGLEAAFLAKLDDERGEVGFRNVLIVNPPVNLFTSVSNLDNIATQGAANYQRVSEVFDPIFERLARYFQQTGKLDLTGDALYQIGQGIDLTDFEKRALIRTAFGISIADMVFATDVLNGYGYVVPPGQSVNVTDKDSTVWFKRALSWRFLDYFHLMVLPAWQMDHPEDSEADAIRQWSLTGIEGYLHNSDHVWVQHNVDDPILGPGDIEFLTATFGDRALIYPTGGHCGNMDYPPNVEHMVNILRAGRP